MSAAAHRPEGNLAESSVAEVLRELHFARATGALEIHAGGQKRRLFLRHGNLYLSGGHPLARRLGEVVVRLRTDDRRDARHAAVGAESAEAHRQCADLVQRMAAVIAEWRQGSFQFHSDPTVLPPDLVGPLPTKRLLMIGATFSAGEQELARRLGGLEAQLVATPRVDGDIDDLGLTPEESFLLERLRQPMRLDQLLEESPVSKLEALRRLVQLRSVRLLRILGREESGPTTEEALDALMMQRFDERFARDLAERPLELTADELRRHTADLLPRLGGMDAYELLGLDPSASPDLVQASYEALARQVHPSHAGRFGVPGMEPMLRMLFERATQSYLVLSEPDRRRRYNESQGISVAAARVSGSQREAEERSLGRQHFERALALAARGEFHFAIELLQLAAKIDPRAEYFLALARLQAKNPNWVRRAIDSCRAALEIDANHAEVRFFLGELFEQIGELDRARVQYSAAAREDPANAVAATKAKELAPQRDAARRSGGLFDRIFRRQD